MLPPRIGRYDVSAEIGRGSTSIVYRAVDPASQRVLAIKTLQRNGADSDADADSILLRFRNEARAIGRLRHPGIVAVDEFGEDGLHSWIAMEHVEGSNLDDVLLRSPLLGQQRVLALMDELLDALGCVHREGICHRDVKPANIMLTTAGRVKLTDFGVARLRDLGLTRVSSIIGTPAFMAPEQFTGGALDHRADLFACGVLLFLLLGGRRPFSGPPAAVMHQILHEEPPSLSAASGGAVGRAFDEVIARALAKRPEDRFSSADDMRVALRDAALQAAEAPLGTLVETLVQTLVQGAGRSSVRVRVDEQAPTQFDRDRDRAVSARPLPPAFDSLARVVMREVPVRPARVDVASLYAADAPAFPGPAGEAAQGPDGPHLPASLVLSAQHLLTRRLGPVAGVLVQRAADSAAGARATFLLNLLAEVPAVERPGLQAELDALLAPPQRAGLGR